MSTLDVFIAVVLGVTFTVVFLANLALMLENLFGDDVAEKIAARKRRPQNHDYMPGALVAGEERCILCKQPRVAHSRERRDRYVGWA